MDQLYERLIHEIHRYEGTVNELTGDGLVAFFGAPVAVEQAPQRAVRAGLAGKIRAYRVTGEHAGRARIDVARERGFTRLVGRERELEHLRHCFDLAQSERGQAVSIIGDAGLGKSRLLYEFRQTLDNHDCLWLDGRCHPYGMALAYGPIVEMLKQRFQLDVSDQDKDIQRKVQHGLQELSPALMSAAPYLLHLLAVETAHGLPAGLAPEAIKHRIF
jgi:hypothetical protein